jgi:hypothetical protein
MDWCVKMVLAHSTPEHKLKAVEVLDRRTSLAAVA